MHQTYSSTPALKASDTFMICVSVSVSGFKNLDLSGVHKYKVQLFFTVNFLLSRSLNFRFELHLHVHSTAGMHHGEILEYKLIGTSTIFSVFQCSTVGQFLRISFVWIKYDFLSSIRMRRTLTGWFLFRANQNLAFCLTFLYLDRSSILQ